MKKLVIGFAMLAMCCCRVSGGGMCCAEQVFCSGGFVMGCFCQSSNDGTETIMGSTLRCSVQSA